MKTGDVVTIPGENFKRIIHLFLSTSPDILPTSAELRHFTPERKLVIDFIEVEYLKQLQAQGCIEEISAHNDAGYERSFKQAFSELSKSERNNRIWEIEIFDEGTEKESYTIRRYKGEKIEESYFPMNKEQAVIGCVAVLLGNQPPRTLRHLD